MMFSAWKGHCALVISERRAVVVVLIIVESHFVRDRPCAAPWDLFPDGFRSWLPFFT